MKNRYRANALPRVLEVWVGVTAAGLLLGCSNAGTPAASAPLPPIPPPSNATAYIGSQAPGYWALTVDDTQKAYSYQSLTGSAPAQSGAFSNTNDILDFGNASGVSLGKAAEQPGVGALLRPGSVETFPVPMIQQSQCIPIASKLRYIYAALPGQGTPNAAPSQTRGYGTFVVSTSADGKSWSFEDLHAYVLTGLSGGLYSAGTEVGSDPSLFSGTCVNTVSIATISADPKAQFSTDSSGNPIVPTFRFNPAGAFVEDRNSTFDGGWMGFAMPVAPISPSVVATGNTYRGFVFEASPANRSDGSAYVAASTQPVALAQATDGTTNLAGGVFPNDDLTQTPGTEYTLSLGKQDATLNGVFPNARLTIADPTAACVNAASQNSNFQSSLDIYGKFVCTAAGVGVVSQVNGKYVIYFTSLDGTSSAAGPIQFYLYQQ